MHVHVLGIGAMGTLIASHLRTAMRQRLMPLMRTRTPRWHVPASVAAYLPDAESLTLTLHMREKAGARKQDDDTPGFTELTVDREGARMTEKGFEVELASPVDPIQTRVFLPDANGIPRERPGRPPRPLDSLIVTAKADATFAAVRSLVPRITPSTTVVLLQNGMGVLDQLIERFWPRPDMRPHFVLGSTTHGCYLRKPLHTIHAGFGSVYLGLVPSAQLATARATTPAKPQGVEPCASKMDLAGLPEGSLRSTLALLLSLPLDVHWEPIRAFQMRALRKLAINACINPTTALVDCKNGDLFGVPAALDLFRALCTEASQVLEAHARDAKAAATTSETEAVHLSSLPLADLLTQTDGDGIPLLDASLKPASLLHEVENVVRATATNWSSMHQDIRTRRGKTEIKYINGYLAELGRAYGIPTPANDMLINLVKLKSQRVTGSWNSRAM
ncbi:hypothetical protein MGL_0714 [Malassezia globosa CBS 7966]|uniref:2-dehydropantoate 2-reductase n=1 Tax=Malassezia globosa (strain ATCC MYA-4612 / CBS 7966) TaxID=425265 RepID=A8PUL9_MALGO|nr:uncharacterized protein MGL_0714 [Malassezia globosa CBS 7966]EDP44907.1 hypothetical protein MGL_0714 [Malassezia globosa CBS 7966]